MIGAGTKSRQLYLERMQQVAVGAKLERKGRLWEIVRQRQTETGVALTLRHGRREFRLYVPVTIHGPELWHFDMQVAALPPSQRALFLYPAGGDHA